MAKLSAQLPINPVGLGVGISMLLKYKISWSLPHMLENPAAVNSSFWAKESVLCTNLA